MVSHDFHNTRALCLPENLAETISTIGVFTDSVRVIGFLSTYLSHLIAHSQRVIGRSRQEVLQDSLPICSSRADSLIRFHPRSAVRASTGYPFVRTMDPLSFTSTLKPSKFGAPIQNPGTLMKICIWEEPRRWTLQLCKRIIQWRDLKTMRLRLLPESQVG